MCNALRLYFRREALRPPPVTEKGSKALSEITSKRKHIYVQRIATIFQTGEHGSPLHWNTQFSSHHNIHIKQIISSKRADNIRPYGLFWFCNQNDWRTRFAATEYFTNKEWISQNTVSTLFYINILSKKPNGALVSVLYQQPQPQLLLSQPQPQPPLFPPQQQRTMIRRIIHEQQPLPLPKLHIRLPPFVYTTYYCERRNV